MNVSGCSPQMAQEIWAMYEDFCGRLEKGTIAREFCDAGSLQKNTAKWGPQSIIGLKVDLPIEQIKEIYEKYHVIQLRDIQSSTSLLIGCGNAPITTIICEGDGHNHTHEEFVTIDPEIHKNPTLVAAFGTQESLHEFLPKRFYVNLVSEMCSIAEDASQLCKNSLACMKEDFKCFRMNSKGELEEEDGFESSYLLNKNSWYY